MPIHIAISMWGTFLSSTHAVFYLDNDAARAALCKGCGGTQLGNLLVQNIKESESTLRLKSWYARVPSHSNISDGSYRLDCTDVTQLGSREVKVDWNKFLRTFVSALFQYGESTGALIPPNCSGKRCGCLWSDFSTLFSRVLTFSLCFYFLRRRRRLLQRFCKEQRFP